MDRHCVHIWGSDQKKESGNCWREAVCSLHDSVLRAVVGVIGIGPSLPAGLVGLADTGRQYDAPVA
jgi:hypothetical protein